MFATMAQYQKSMTEIFPTGSSPSKGRIDQRRTECSSRSFRLVKKPVTLTLRQLLSDYEQITCPITLVCAGNRRKEQNQVRKTKGFSWGAAGLSTALFTGVAMSELIRRAQPTRKARYVCMEGADKLVRHCLCPRVSLVKLISCNSQTATMVRLSSSTGYWIRTEG